MMSKIWDFGGVQMHGGDDAEGIIPECIWTPPPILGRARGLRHNFSKRCILRCSVRWFNFQLNPSHF